MRKKKRKKTASGRKQSLNVTVDLNISGVTESNCDDILRKNKESIKSLFETITRNQGCIL